MTLAVSPPFVLTIGPELCHDGVTLTLKLAAVDGVTPAALLQPSEPTVGWIAGVASASQGQYLLPDSKSLA